MPSISKMVRGASRSTRSESPEQAGATHSERAKKSGKTKFAQVVPQALDEQETKDIDNKAHDEVAEKEAQEVDKKVFSYQLLYDSEERMVSESDSMAEGETLNSSSSPRSGGLKASLTHMKIGIPRAFRRAPAPAPTQKRVPSRSRSATLEKINEDAGCRRRHFGFGRSLRAAVH